MDSNLKREIMIDNYENPFHKKIVLDQEFIKANTHNESCIDDVTLYIRIQDGIIKDAYFDGEACAITTSATSIMLKKIIGLSLNDAKKLINNYYFMVDEKDYDESQMGELLAYNEIGHQPSRIKCAILPFQTLEKTIKIYEEGKNEK